MKTKGDFIIYVDESGDHSIKGLDKDYPIFVLTFCSIVLANVKVKKGSLYLD